MRMFYNGVEFEGTVDEIKELIDTKLHITSINVVDNECNNVGTIVRSIINEFNTHGQDDTVLDDTVLDDKPIVEKATAKKATAKKATAKKATAKKATAKKATAKTYKKYYSSLSEIPEPTRTKWMDVATKVGEYLIKKKTPVTKKMLAKKFHAHKLVAPLIWKELNARGFKVSMWAVSA